MQQLLFLLQSIQLLTHIMMQLVEIQLLQVILQLAVQQYHCRLQLVLVTLSMVGTQTQD